MDSEDLIKRRKKQRFKVFLIETFMVVAVISLVVASTFVAIGYNINLRSSEDIIERTGLVAIRTKPTGANLEIDGEQVFGWTNISKTLAEGEHHIRIFKDGYRTFDKDISVTAGLLYRINYPRLIPEELSYEKMLDFSNVLTYSIAPDENSCLVLTKDGKFLLYRLNSDKISEPSVIDFEENVEYFEVLSWSGNSKRLLFRYNSDVYLFDIARPERSKNISETLLSGAKEIKFFDDAGSIVYGILEGNLVSFNFDSREGAPEIVFPNVYNYDFCNDYIALVYKDSQDDESSAKVGVLRVGDSQVLKLDSYGSKDASTQINLVSYYGEYYLGVLDSQDIKVFGGQIEANEEKELELAEVFSSKNEGYSSFVRGVGEGLIEMEDAKQTKFIGYDIEADKEFSFETPSEARILDGQMMYFVQDGALFVADYDGKNIQKIADEKVDSKKEIKISGNDKWIYYSQNDGVLYRILILK